MVELAIKGIFNLPKHTFWSYFPPYFTYVCTAVVSSNRFLQQVIIIIMIILEDRALFPIFITSQLMPGYCTLPGRMWRPFLSVQQSLQPSRL